MIDLIFYLMTQRCKPQEAKENLTGGNGSILK